MSKTAKQILMNVADKNQTIANTILGVADANKTGDINPTVISTELGCIGHDQTTVKNVVRP